MRGELAAAGTAICWSLTAIFFSIGGRRIGSATVNRTRLLFAVVYISLFHWLLQGTPFPFGTEGWRWGVLTLSAVLGLGVGDGALFYAYVLIGPRLAMLVMTLVPVFSSLFAWLLFGETIAPHEFAGMVVALAAIGWVISERQAGAPPPAARPLAAPDTAQAQAPNRNYPLGLAMALVGALGQTSNLIVTKYALLDGYSALSATLIRIVVAMVALWALAGVRGEIGTSLARLRDRVALAAIAAGALVGPFLGIWFSLIAVQTTRVGIASTIMALPPVLLIPLSAILLKERVTPRAVIGTLTAVGGVALLFL